MILPLDKRFYSTNWWIKSRTNVLIQLQICENGVKFMGMFWCKNECYRCWYPITVTNRRDLNNPSKFCTTISYASWKTPKRLDIYHSVIFLQGQGFDYFCHQYRAGELLKRLQLKLGIFVTYTKIRVFQKQ